MSDIGTLALPDSNPSDPGSGFPPDTPLDQRLRHALGADYELGPQIGQGGMGVVFRAMDLRLKREVAIKVLPPEVTYRADLRKRFVREAQLAASLSHPHIVPIYDVGQRHGLAWFVMALIHGESVRDMVRRGGPQPVHVTARVMRETAWALSYAHARGVIHRDIKPDNIMIDRASGRAIVMDFGLAKIDSEDDQVTHHGAVIGTPAYMAPEQARGETTVDHRVDIYSLGMVGHYMMTGRNPFDAPNARAVVAKVINESAPPVERFRPDAPVWIVDIIRKSGARKPDERYDKAEQLAEALDRGGSERPIPASIQYLLVWLEAYVELSILTCWFLFIVGVPSIRLGGWLIMASLLSLPLLFSLQLINAEGLKWPEIREAVILWRLHILRCLNIKREAGINIPSIAVGLITVVGVFGVRWIPTLVGYLQNRFGNWDTVTEIDPGPVELLFQGPRWAFWYAFLGSVVWAQLFGLPLTKRISPERLDKVATWRMPKWMDLLGMVLFARFRASSRVVMASADFRQLAEPAVQAAIVYNRLKRGLRWVERIRLWYPILLGDFVVKRAWWTEERLRRLKDKWTGRTPSERVQRAILHRENVLAECAGALNGLRVWIEENVGMRSTDAGEREQDDRVVEELKRLARPLRVIRWTNLTLVGLWLAVAISNEIIFKGQPTVHLAHTALGPALLAIMVFQLFKRRFYS